MKKYIILTLCIVAAIKLSAQPFTLKGRVLQNETNKTLERASVQIIETNQGTSTNTKGEFLFQIKQNGKYTIKASFIGYNTVEQIVFIEKDTLVEVKLDPESTTLSEVKIVSSQTFQGSNNSQAGMQKLSISSIKQLPAFLGEVDPIKAIRLTPGVQAGGEGNGGLFVRGSDPGQNLILLEDIPIYNPTHLLGLYSVFNPGILKNVTLFKGAYPALYGGRASSLLKIGLNDGIPDNAETEISVGYISSRASTRIPMFKNNASLLLGGRYTYLQALAPVFKALSHENYLENNMYNFNDINARFELNFSPKNKLILNAYSGTDKYKLLQSSIGITNTMNWGNQAATLKHIHLFNSTCSWSNTIGITSYFFNLNANYQQYSLKLNSKVFDPFWRSELYLSLPKHFIQGGLETIFHENVPESAKVKINDALYESNPRFRSGEVSIFINDNYKLSPKITIVAGLRITNYTHLGPYDKYIKEVSGNVYDTLHYGYNKSVKTYYGVNPRLAINIMKSDKVSYKVSLSRNHQYIHLISVGSVSLPTDIWFPSTTNVKPEYTDQIALGYHRTFENNEFEASCDLYFRHLNNVIEFKNSIMSSYKYNEFEESIVHGDGYSFGSECFFRKNIGEITGWISYTLAWTLRKFDEINDGKFYYGKYDRRHDLAITLQYQLNEHWNLSSVFIYSTGNAMTLPSGRYMIQGEIINDYTSVNTFRMPTYHRLDLSATRSRKLSGKRESTWNFSVYNAYNRANPYYIFFEAKGNIEDYQLSVKAKKVNLFPILPSISWTLKF